MATQTLAGKLTFDEYLELERAATTKSEYRGGEIFAMSGGTPVHARLGGRMIVLLDHAVGHACQIFSSDLRVYAAAVNEAMYPDVSVACEELKFRDGRRDVILNPSLVVEILSSSTRDYDLSMKASFYRSIPSLTDILFVDSERRYVQRQSRQDGRWTIEEFTANEQAVWRPGEHAITVHDIYDGIDLPRPE